MIRPAGFLSNPETAASNAFQRSDLDAISAQAAAAREFDAYVLRLRAAGVGVEVIDDMPAPHTPDSIFPNNWVSFHQDGRVFLYPMQAPNRRRERRASILAKINERFAIRDVVDQSGFENEGRYLEGTGSLVMDHENRIAYVCHSSRSHPDVMAAFAARSGYRPVWFHATDRRGQAIYHTNVMMCVGRTLAVVCTEAIADPAERKLLSESLAETGKGLIAISHQQMEAFAGNMLELRSSSGRPVFALSRRAWAALSEQQRRTISEYAEPVLAPIDTIERLGGGGARCMIAEIFLPKREPVRCARDDPASADYAG